MWFFIISIALLYLIFVLLDFVAPAREQPNSQFWRLRGLLSMFLYFGIAFTAPALWDAVLAQHTLMNAATLPLAVQILGGFIILQLGIYLWHRALHASDILWRFSHRFHHSAERIDIWGAFWFHPIDSFAWTLVGSLALVGVIGISVPAAIAINIFGVFTAMFQHANLSTPRWLGYFVIRPENHSLHHARGEHRWNYCDLPLIDMIFGTFKNVRSAPSQNGFFDGASQQLVALLFGLNLAKNPSDESSVNEVLSGERSESVLNSESAL
jgi:sterol desaturase/sphingolipid hydroxylase (fatty acid hydroxylase superfamily)